MNEAIKITNVDFGIAARDCVSDNYSIGKCKGMSTL
jgi:hypothetical protein